LWIATDGGGIDIFDGNKFSNIGIEQGLPYGRIQTLYVSDRNYVICGVRQHFFSIILPDTILNFNIDPTYRNSTVTAIHGDSSGRIWMATDGGSLLELRSDYEVVPIASFESPIQSIWVVDSSQIFVGTTKGLYIKRGGNFYKEPFFKDEIINSITQFSDKTIWVATAAGVACLQQNKWIWQEVLNHMLNAQVTQLVEGSESEVWISTFGDGIILWNHNFPLFLNDRHGLPNNFCKTMVYDQSGNLWIGTDGGGLIKYSGDRFYHFFKTDKTYFDPVMSICQTQDQRIWVATFGSGIITIDKSGESRPFVNNHLLSTKIIYTLLPLNERHLLVGSKYANTLLIDIVNNNVQTLFDKNRKPIFGATFAISDSLGRIWIGTNGDGLYVFKDKKQIHLTTQLPSQKITTLSASDLKRIWIGTEDMGAFSIETIQIDNALNRIIPEEEVSFTPAPLHTNMMVTGIAVDFLGGVWFGTYGQGLFSLKSDGKVEHYTKSTGLQSNNIYSVLSDGERNLWIGTDRGLNRINIKSKDTLSFLSYDSYTGFPGLECNINALFVDSERRVWIGNIFGVSVYNPIGKEAQSTPMKLHITNVSIKAQKKNLFPYLTSDSLTIVLPYSENNITFDFQAIDMFMPEKVVYLYRLEGLDEEWKSKDQTGQAHYSFIPPGKYVFRVKARSGSGIESKNEIIVPITVNPPFWLTPWFATLVLVLLVTSAILISRYRQYALIKRNEILQELVTSRTLQLQMETMMVKQQGEELRVQAEQLAATNAELQKLSIVASKTDSAILIANKNFEWEWVNEGFSKLYGYTFEEFIERQGKTIQETSYNRKIEHILEEALTQKKSVVYSSKAVHASGREMWVQSTLTPIFDDDEQLQMIVVIDVDITHIKQINNELRKLSLVASKTDNAVIIMNKHGEIEWVNEGFHRMYELSLDEFKNLYGITIFELHRDAQSLKQIQELYHTNQTQTFESKFVTSKGNEKWIQTVLTPIISPGQQYEQLIAVESDITRIKKAEEQLAIEKNKVDTLLLNILPQEIAEELKSKGHATPRYYKSVTILFADIKSFSTYCQNLSPQELLHELHEYFNTFDEIVKESMVEKIKTIGDAYMCAGGLPIPNRSHPFDVVLVGLRIQQAANEINLRKQKEGRVPWQFRIGIHTGEIVSGVIGKYKFAYDIWGDSVNVASRLESACEPGLVNISGETYKLIKDFFYCEYRGKIEIKNRGKIDMFFVKSIKAEYSVDGKGIEPNERFKLFLAEL